MQNFMSPRCFFYTLSNERVPWLSGAFESLGHFQREGFLRSDVNVKKKACVQSTTRVPFFHSQNACGWAVKLYSPMAGENTVTQIFQNFSLLTAQAWLHGKCQRRAPLLWWIVKPLKSKCTWKQSLEGRLCNYVARLCQSLSSTDGHQIQKARGFVLMLVLLCKPWYSDVWKSELTHKRWSVSKP